MKIINEADVTLECIQDLFKQKGGITSLIELSPADESSGVRREGFLEVVATDNTKIIIWTNSNGEPEPILRMRAILMSHGKKKFKKAI